MLEAMCTDYWRIPEKLSGKDEFQTEPEWQIWIHQVQKWGWGCQGLLLAQLIVIQLPSHVWFLVTPWIAARQASLFFTFPEFAQIHVHWVGDAI